MLADSASGEESCCSYLRSTLVPVSSPHRSGEVSRLLASAGRRSGLEAREPRSAGFAVALDIDLPFASLPLPIARLLLAAFGPDRIRHFAATSNRRLSEDHSRSAPERP
jgi:hypothetical protein